MGVLGIWLRGQDLNLRPSGYEPDELPGCSTPRCGWCVVDMVRGAVFCRPGSDLLSHVLRHSTIGAEEFNGRVRDGIGFGLLARATRPAKDRKPRGDLGCRLAAMCERDREGSSREAHKMVVSFHRQVARRRGGPGGRWYAMSIVNGSDQADQAISTGKLHGSLRFHTRPINVVVYHGFQGRTHLEVGFPLRCLQRLSRPYIATLHCGWRHNRSTRGTSIPVLSY